MCLYSCLDTNIYPGAGLRATNNRCLSSVCLSVLESRHKLLKQSCKLCIAKLKDMMLCYLALLEREGMTQQWLNACRPTCRISSICVTEGGTRARGRDKASSNFTLRTMVFLKWSRASCLTEGSLPCTQQRQRKQLDWATLTISEGWIVRARAPTLERSGPAWSAGSIAPSKHTPHLRQRWLDCCKTWLDHCAHHQISPLSFKKPKITAATEPR